MKCWKCGQENSDGVSTCLYCGASQSRAAASTEVGRAMRKLYDHYGCKTVLSNSAYLVNGLGDLTEDSKKLRNQIKMAMDAGMGRMYLEQLSVGHPDAGFQERIKMLLTEDAGLNDGTAKQLMGYFDEMIGWKVVQIPKKQTHRPKVPPKPNPKPKLHYEQKRAGSDEVRRDSTLREPVPSTTAEGTKEKRKLYPCEVVVLLGCVEFIILVILGACGISFEHDKNFALAVFFSPFLISVLLFFIKPNPEEKRKEAPPLARAVLTIISGVCGLSGFCGILATFVSLMYGQAGEEGFLTVLAVFLIPFVYCIVWIFGYKRTQKV